MNEPSTDSPDRKLFCSFWLGEQWFGIDALLVKEVSAQAAFTPIPLAPAAVRGYVNLRGQLYLALDMRGLLGLPAASPQTEGHLIVFKPAAGESFAVYVDRIGHIVEVEEGQIDQPKDEDGESGTLISFELRFAGLISGVAKLDTGLMTVVDPHRFLPALLHGTNVS
jgi:purine-binding chemotaxis protein CheW